MSQVGCRSRLPANLQHTRAGFIRLVTTVNSTLMWTQLGDQHNATGGDPSSNDGPQRRNALDGVMRDNAA